MTGSPRSLLPELRFDALLTDELLTLAQPARIRTGFAGATTRASVSGLERRRKAGR